MHEILCFMAYKTTLSHFSFAQAKSEYLEESKLVLPVQINGKTRGIILVDLHALRMIVSKLQPRTRKRHQEENLYLEGS